MRALLEGDDIDLVEAERADFSADLLSVKQPCRQNEVEGAQLGS